MLHASLTLSLAASAFQADACEWESLQPTPQAIVEAHSVVVDQKLYLMGGFFSSSLKGTPRTDVYDPQTDTWTGLADMLTVVTHHTAVPDGQNIWCAGGFFGDNGGFVVNDVQVYDITTDSWSFAPILPGRRAGGAMVRLGRNLHYFGGFATRLTNADDHYVLDLDNPSAGWDSTSFAALPMGRGHLSGAVLNGMIYAIGGQFGHDVNPTDLDLVHRYDPATNQWTQVASLPTPRSHFEASTFVYDGRIFVAGGRNNQGGGSQLLQTLTAYDPASDTWSDVSSLPVPLIGPSAKPIGDTLYLSSGGLTPNSPTAMNHRRAVEPVLGSGAKINAGGPMLSLGADWCMDSFYSDGLPAISPLSPAIAGTTDDMLYWSERTSSVAMGSQFSYDLPVEDGNYRVDLHFAELQASAPGQRVFDVSLEGSLVLRSYDIVQSVGALSADVHSFDTRVQDGVLELDFSGLVGQPTLSGIELERLPDDAYRVFCPGAPNSVGSGARLYFVGSTSLAQGNISLVSSGLPPGELARFVLGGQQTMLPFGSGTLCLGGYMLFSPIVSVSPAGVISGALPTSLILPGSRLNFQVIYTDSAPFRFNASDGFEVSFTL